jgi:chaperonin cofactor prefoldin
LIESTKQQNVDDLRKQKEKLDKKIATMESNTKPSENLSKNK